MMIRLASSSMLLVFSVVTPAQNLIFNGGFESGVGPVCSGFGGPQGLLPTPWVQAGLISGGADTYTADCAVLAGLNNSWPNYIPHAGHCGVRWAAAYNGSNPVEALGSPLQAAIAPNTTYLLAAWFRRSILGGFTGAAGLDVRFGFNSSITSSSLQVASFGSGVAAPGAWEERASVFTTGASAPPYTHIVLAAALGSISYMGVDDLVLVPVGTYYTYPQGVGNSHTLAGSGAVQGGSSITLTANSSLPGLPCILAAGIESLCAPILGQVLTVNPLLTTWTLTDSAGTAAFPFAWPSGLPQGIRAYFQTWILDGGGNFSASNGIAAVGG